MVLFTHAAYLSILCINSGCFVGIYEVWMEGAEKEEITDWQLLFGGKTLRFQARSFCPPLKADACYMQPILSLDY